jgi:hypothetical protein
MNAADDRFSTNRTVLLCYDGSGDPAGFDVARSGDHGGSTV